MASKRTSRWMEIQNELQAQIERGERKEGDEFPGELELCEQYGVSRTTIRRVFKELFQGGYAEIRPGKNRRVSLPIRYLNFDTGEESTGRHLGRIAKREKWRREDLPFDRVLEPPHRGRWYSMAQEPRLPPHEVRDALKLGDNDHVTWLLRARCAKRKPLMLQWVVTPISLVPLIRFEDLELGGLTKVYRGAGVKRHSYASNFFAVAASGPEGRHLEVATGTPLICEHRISYCKLGGKTKPFELLVALYTSRIRPEFRWSVEQAGRTSNSSRGRGSKRKTTAKKRAGGD